MEFGLKNERCLKGGLTQWIEEGRRVEPLGWESSSF